MFTGAGGFELALEDHECVGMSEIDKYANAVLAYQFPNTRNYGDCKEINWSEVPDFDLLVGGSPCQDLSVAGKQAGLSGERSGLFTEFVRALQEKKPEHFIWENVKGTLSSNKGWDFAEVQAQMADAGYSLWWQVLNAKDFGVAQNRERIFVVGTRTAGPREILFERGADEEDSRSVGEDVAYAIDANYHKGTNRIDKGRRSIVQINKPKHSNDRVYSDEGISPTLNTMQGGRRQPFVQRQPLRFLNRNQKNIEGDYAFTVDASQTSGVRTGERIRRLTPKECERLMSWPDDWTRWGIIDGEKKEMSDTQRYKMCGNGVVSEVVKEVVKAHFDV